MKAKERHRLKENEFARMVAQAQKVMATRSRDIATLVVVVIAALLLASGYAWWRQSRNDKASAGELLDRRPDRVVISPGPCTPAEAGVSVEAARARARHLTSPDRDANPPAHDRP